MNIDVFEEPKGISLKMPFEEMSEIRNKLNSGS
jgi:hypothetical protein